MKTEEIINLCQWYNLAQKEDLKICEQYIQKFKDLGIYKDITFKRDRKKYPYVFKYLGKEVEH